MADGTDRSASGGLRGTNQTGMRAQNERLVLTLVRRHGALAKAEIARLTDLSAQTVSVIMRSLEDDGLLLRGTPQRGRVGQPSVPIQLNPEGAYFLGLKIGRRSVEMVLTDFLGRIVGRCIRLHSYPDFDEVLEFSLRAAAELSAQLPQTAQRRIAGLGIAIPFQIWDWGPIIGVVAPRMEDWRNRDIAAELESNLHLPVFLQNDATAACAAELAFGTGEQPADVLAFYVAFFIGGGVVIDGRLFSGPLGNAGALGSMPVPDGQGGMLQLIDLASLMVLERHLVARGIDPMTLWQNPDDWDIPCDIRQDWVVQAGQAIAHAAHAAMAVIDFPVIRIDGWMPAALRADLVAQVERSFGGLDFRGLNCPRVITGTIGADARALGAASQPLIRRFLTGLSR